MRKIGENVLYGASGVMTIVDIREESIGDVSRSYYVLRPANSRSQSLTFVPADNEKLVGAMHSLLTRDEIMEILHNARNLPECQWIEGNRARAEYFKSIMESGDRVKMIAMIRAIDENGVRRNEEGRKNFLTDENAKQKAQKLLYSEFSLVLGISEDEIAEFVDNEMKKG